MKTEFHHRTTNKSVALALSLVSVLILLCGCSSDPKNFTVDNFTITLNESFELSSAQNFDIYIKSDDVIFTAVEETAEELEYSGFEINSLKDYCSELMKINNASSSLQQRNNYYYFTHTETRSGASYSYIHCMFSTKDSYWVCIFACKTKDYDRLENKIFQWADSIVIK